MNRPAHETKHLTELQYTLPNGTRVCIAQDASSADSTGRTVWLGAQVLAVYLHDVLKPPRPSLPGGRRKRVLELGSGTGLLGLSLFSLGYDTLATDLDFIVAGVLAQNVERNLDVIKTGGAGEARMEKRVLDWFVEPIRWEGHVDRGADRGTRLLEPPFDLIVTADTVYDSSLSEPLLRTLHGLARSSPSAPIYLALERRDPALVDSFLSSAAETWGFKCSQVEHARLRRVVESKEGTLAWEADAWDGVEVWKLKLGREKAGKRR
ncbi:hypothetical protein JCM11641_007744, partial [Rhodosporidiobolus odoratus]